MCFNRCTIGRATRNISALLVAFGLLSTLGACVTGTTSASGSSDLEQWVEQEGAAYVIDQLQNDPRFAGASVQLVHLDGGVITPDVSILSDDVRRQLFSAVLRVQGIDLAVRPSVRPWQAQRTLASIDCGLLKPVTHVVGLDLRATASGNQRLSLRALDMRDNAWVSGFEKTWTGRLTSTQVAALRAPATDLSLRGLRQLPFDGLQADLTASYLARNLSCLLQQGAPERLKLYFAPVRGAPDYFTSVGRLLSRYMNQYREVEVVSDPSAANAVVNSDVVQLGGELWQVWMGVAFTDAGSQVSGADTPAYVSLDSTAAFGSGKIILETRPELEGVGERWPATE